MHPQHWSDELGYTSKKYGSGRYCRSRSHANPSLADWAEKVTILQHSPCYLMSAYKYSKFAFVSCKMFPRRTSYFYHPDIQKLQAAVLWFIAHKTPKVVKWIARRTAVSNFLDGYSVDTHY